MAGGLSHRLYCIQSLYNPHQCFCFPAAAANFANKSLTLTQNQLSLRLLRATVPKSSNSKNSSTPDQEPSSSAPISPEGVNSAESAPFSSSPSPYDFLFAPFSRFREGLEVDGLGLEIVSIALPAALALAADPIASLVNTAFIGHLGSVELAAVGVSVSVFNLVSKLLNVPLLNITTSFVAEEQALIAKRNGEDNKIDQGFAFDHQKKILLPSVSTSLALAAVIGIAEALALSVGSGFLMNIMGIPADSPMRIPAQQFLTLKAFGAPPIVIALAAQGTFRGFRDTKTPLYAVGAGNLLNATLDPILIFFLGFGIKGAAIATVISEYFIAFILLSKLNDKVSLGFPTINGGRVARYLKSGGLLIARTVAVLVTMTLATSMAAKEGPVSMAGHQICLQVWLAVSLLTDALALAGQSLLASGYSGGDYDQARKVVFKVLQIGLTTGVALASILFLGFEALSSLFSNDPEVLKIVRSGILQFYEKKIAVWVGYFKLNFWPRYGLTGEVFVAGSQPINALAFVLDGLYYGVSDFGYAAYSMIVVGIISSAFLLVASPIFGLAGIWTGLSLFMTLRVVAGIWRLGTKGGPWKFLWPEEQENS